MQYNLLSALGNRDQTDVSCTLLGMSTSPDNCAAMRSSGCLPLIVGLLYAPDSSQDMKKHVALALNNIVNCNPDEVQSELERDVLSSLENVRHYCDILAHHPNSAEAESRVKDIVKTVALILRKSFDGEHRLVMSVLGGIHSLAYLIQVLHETSGSKEDCIHFVMLKRLASMALTNLTAGHISNKALLCSLKLFMHALVAQLNSPSEELQQATASIIRNLSWKVDDVAEDILRETGAISVLMKVAMKVKRESTLQSILSALWNLSFNSSLNKIELCAVPGALGFLTHALSYKAPSQELGVVDYAGGILRNISSHVAEREDYRAILRKHDCLQVLAQHLTFPSDQFPRVVGNACIILWNLSFDCSEDQYTLWMLGVPNLLRNLVHSENKLIAWGSSAALKNLVSGRPESDKFYTLLVGLPTGSSLNGRSSKTVEEKLDEVLLESCREKENVSPSTVTGRRDDKFVFSLTDVQKKRQQRRSYRSHSLTRSGSNELLSSARLENNHGMIKINSNGDRKHSSNTDLTSNEESTKLCTETNDQKSNKLFEKDACLSMKNDTGEDLNFVNEAISNVYELQEVVNDMAYLRLNEDSTSENGESKNDVAGQSDEFEVRSEERNDAQLGTNISKRDQETPEAIDSSELKSEDNSVVKRKPVTGKVCSVTVEKSELKQLPKEEFVTGEVRSLVKQESVISPEELPDETGFSKSDPIKTESLASPEELQRSLEKLTLTSVELQPSLGHTPSDELSYTEDSSIPKNVSLSSRSVEDLSTDELTTEDISLVKEESATSPEESQRSFEEPPSGELTKVKEELATPEKLERSLEELTFDEDSKEGSSLLDCPPGVIDRQRNAHYVPDFSQEDPETPSKRQPERASSPEEYGDYAETDLDQPTDYSLQYGEEDELTDEDVLHQSNKRDATFFDTGVPISIHEDTVKTYCTEGTPFETPYNFSTATSMSDLRAEPSIKEEMDEIECDTASDCQKDVGSGMLVCGSVQVKTELVEDALLLDRIHSMDCGLVSPPEKPVEFCEEGTPGQRMSRFSSLSSFCGESQMERPQHKGSVSRGSCSSYEGNEHAYQDISCHPKSLNGVEDKFNSKNNDSDKLQPVIVRPSVFEDAMVSFKDETTPTNFSCATSLSSLSFDDEPKIPMDISLRRDVALRRPNTDTIPQSSHDSAERHSDPALPTCSNFRRKEVFPQDSMQEPNSKVSAGVRSPRVVIKQENGALMTASDRLDGEDADACEDCTYRFCTEGTPANISHAGSHTDLSVLSTPRHRSGKLSDKVDESSDDNLSLTDDGYDMLNECIMSGMSKMTEPKRSAGKQTTSLPVENGNGSNERFVPKDEDDECEQRDNAKQCEDIGDRGKVVTFDDADHYAEETPLMFSRASSLASLSSFDQQSIIDDRSSIISDLSRLTSGAVSPSEIPDSSSQLVSASPQRSKGPSVGEADDLVRNVKPGFSVLPQTTSHQSFNVTQTCVFEDDVKPFKVEDTPVEFSRATSLSSLSICDDANPADEAGVCLTKGEREDSKGAPNEEDKDKADEESDRNSLDFEIEGDEDNAMLEECISIGRLQGRKTQDSNSSLFNNYENRNQFAPSGSHTNYPVNHSNNSPNHTNHLENHCRLSPTKSEHRSSPKPHRQVPNIVKIPSRCSEPVPASSAFDETTHRYFTEDTSANISHAGSHSDLSVLSFPSEKDEPQDQDSSRRQSTTELWDEWLNVPDDQNLLEECIQAGMPKKNTRKKRNNSFSTCPERETNSNSSPRHQFRDDRIGIDSIHDRPRSSTSSQLSPVSHKSRPPSRPVSTNAHVYSCTTKSSHSRKCRRAVLTVEPRRIEGAGAFEDSLYRFNMEDTPGNISHAGSQSDISVLSIPDDDKDFHHDFHKHNRRQHSFHDLSDDSPLNSDNETILAECIKLGMPKAKSASRPNNKPNHSGPSTSHSFPHHPLDPNLNFQRRSINQVPAQQFRHGSRTTARTNKTAVFTRRSLSQSDRPQNYPVNVNHSFVMPHQPYGNEATLNRNVTPTGMWSTATTHRLPFNRDKEMIHARSPPYYPNNNNSFPHDSGWEMDASALKDSQALRSMLQNQQNSWFPKFYSASPSNRRHSESQSSCTSFYSRENSSSKLQSIGDLAAASMKGPCVQSSQAPTPLPPNIRPFDRQRTFTKLEPPLHAHLPSPSSKTKIPVPAQVPANLPEKSVSSSKKMVNVEQTIAKGKLKPKTLVAASQPKKIDQEKISDRTKSSKSTSGYLSSTSRASSSKSGQSTSTSTSSSSTLVFKQNTAERRSFRVSRPTGLEDKRSNSFSSITSSASSKSSVRPFKKEVASKVASLWKRTDTSSDDGQCKTNAKSDGKNSGNEKRAAVTRKMERSATFEGLPRNMELSKMDKIKDDSQIRPSNHADRSKKVSKSRFLINKEEQNNKFKSQTQYNKSNQSVHNSRDHPCTSVISRLDRAVSKASSKADQNSFRVTKV